jgi:hypothetical protein
MFTGAAADHHLQVNDTTWVTYLIGSFPADSGSVYEKEILENSWASAILAEPSCAVEDNKLLRAERMKFKGHERL